MPYYINTTTIGGYLVNRPQLKYTGNGKAVANFIVALNKPGKTKPDYIACVAWEDRAHNLVRYAEKGQEISITGELESSTWKDRNHTNHTTTKILVEKFCLGAPTRASQSNEMIVRKPTPPIFNKPSVEE